MTGRSLMARHPDPNARTLLLAAAEEVFSEFGLEATKVEEIARRAGLAKGSFYLHFDGKEDAFLQVVESFLARCATHCAVPSVSVTETLDAAEHLRRGLAADRAMFEFLWENRALIRILSTCHGPHAYLLQNFRMRMLETCESALRFGQDRGFYRKKLDVRLAAHLMAGAYDALVQRALLSKTRPPFERWLRDTQEFFARTIGTEELLQELSRPEGHASQAAPRPVTYRSRISHPTKPTRASLTKRTLHKGSHG